MGSQARPAFFCARPNGTLTPLIAMDELPTHITVRGVPRNITPGETQGMISCGVAVPRPQPWIVDAPDSTVQNANANLADASELVDILVKILEEEPISNHLRHQVQDALVRYTNNFQQAANKPQKEYCSYWIRHGECDYAQQGCLFKHEMPTDPVLLVRLGLRDIPKWYREAYGVPSIHDEAYGNYRAQLATTEQPPMRAIQYNTPTNAITERNGNGNHNAQYRGLNGRYRAPRGVGYPGRGRGNHLQRGGNRMNINQPPAVETPSSRSPNFSDQSWIDAAPSTTGIKNLNMGHIDPQEDGGVMLPAQHILNKNEPMGHLTFNDPEKPLYRTKSRRPWTKTHDGKRPSPDASPDASPVSADESNVSTTGPVDIQASDAKDVKAVTVVNVQDADSTNVETATVVKALTHNAHDDSTVTTAAGSNSDTCDETTVTSVIGPILNLMDNDPFSPFDPFTAYRPPAIRSIGSRQLPHSALAELAKNTDPIISKGNRAIWTAIGEPVRRYPFNFGQAGSSNGAEFGW